MAFYRIVEAGPGALHLSPRPMGDELDEWAAEVALMDIRHVVSLISDAEIKDYGLEGEAEALAAHAVSFHHFPIDDFETGETEAFTRLVRETGHHLNEGNGVLVHCAGGVGRAGTLACCLLVDQQIAPDAAIKAVSRARGASVPETEAQRQVVHDFAR